MKSKLFFLLVAICLSTTFISGQNSYQRTPNDSLQKEVVVVLKTEYGNMRIKLHNDTPLHRDNFIKLTKEGFYTDLLFHRVIEGFMIQGGDPLSKQAPAGAMLGMGENGYTIPAEIIPGKRHVKGMLAAARTGDDVNPTKASSGCQFYIVQGRKFDMRELNAINANRKNKFNGKDFKQYSSIGGSPWLDGEYTIFGEVIEGLDVIDRIASQKCDQNNRPIQDIKFSITIE